jgi:hypothetical protein
VSYSIPSDCDKIYYHTCVNINKISPALGLLALTIGFGAIFVYGINTYGGETCPMTSLWGTDLGHFANWFGIAAFCFGIPPIQFSISEAMAEPERFTTVLGYALVVKKRVHHI